MHSFELITTILLALIYYELRSQSSLRKLMQEHFKEKLFGNQRCVWCTKLIGWESPGVVNEYIIEPGGLFIHKSCDSRRKTWLEEKENEKQHLIMEEKKKESDKLKKKLDELINKND